MKIKVISLNLWNGGRLWQQVSQFLVAQRAEVMLLQEAYDGHDRHLKPRFRTVELLTQLFPDYDSHFEPVLIDTRTQEGEIPEGQLILAKFPLTDRQHLFFDIPFGKYSEELTTDFSIFPASVQISHLQLPKQTLKLLNVHGPVDLNGTRDNHRRQRMKQVLLQQIKSALPVILAGDFNGQPALPSIQALGHQLTNVFADHQLTTTFNIKRKDLIKFPGYAQAVVDMMFVSPQFKVLTADCPTVDVSDHLPLIATFDV